MIKVSYPKSIQILITSYIILMMQFKTLAGTMILVHSEILLKI